MEHGDDARRKFVEACRERYADDVITLKDIEDFNSKYRRDEAIWWYTQEKIFYRLLNEGLRLLDTDILLDMGFFIHDLDQFIKRLHRKQAAKIGDEEFVVYRGQGLSEAALEELKNSEGQVMSYNTFLSTSRQRSESLAFTRAASRKANTVGILFVMKIDPKLKSAPFADVKDYSRYKAEEEVLFSTHTVFRVGKTREMNEGCKFFEVQLTLTEIEDEEFIRLTDRMERELCGKTGWQRLIDLLIQVGKFDDAEDLCHSSLKKTPSKEEEAYIYHYLAMIKMEKGAYRAAIDYHQKSLSIKKEIFPRNHPELAASYNNLGMAYKNKGDYKNALPHYEKALEIYRKTSQPEDIVLANPYNNIGLLYDHMGEQTQALSFCEKALAIRKKHLPKRHPDIGQSYNNLASIYKHMKNYEKALSYYEDALDILESSLLPDHPHIASVRESIKIMKEELSR